MNAGVYLDPPVPTRAETAEQRENKQRNEKSESARNQSSNARRTLIAAAEDCCASARPRPLNNRPAVQLVAHFH